MKPTSHLKDKDHLLQRSEKLVRESTQNPSVTAAHNVNRDVLPQQTRRDFKLRQYYRDLQLWVEGDKQ